MLINNFRIMNALLHRDYKMMASGLIDDWINSLLILAMAYINFVFFGSRFNIDQTFAIQSVIGIIVTICMSLEFGRTYIDLVERYETGVLNYRKTLMLSTRWLLSTFVMSHAINLLVVSLIPVVCVWFLSASYAVLTLKSIVQFCSVWIGGILFLSTFFVNMLCMMPFDWFRINIWQRLLTPLNLTGCVLFPWSRLYDFSPLLGRIALCNPMTYFCEGLRMSLHGSDNAYLFMIGIWVWFLISSAILFTYGKRRLEHA